MTDMAMTVGKSRPREWFVYARGLLEAVPMSLILLGVRFGIGDIFFASGMIKYKSFEFAVRLFQDEYKLPLLDPTVGATLAMICELTFPIFLFLGLATRFAALPLLGMTAVIFYIYPASWNESLLWASALGLLITRGGGTFSLDYLIERAIAGKSMPKMMAM
jgi:putative oxidoreductase